MHLLLISHYWSPEQGVVQRRWEWLSSAILRDKIKLSVVTPPPHYPGGKLLSDLPHYQAGAVDTSVEGLTVYRTRFAEHNQSIVSRIVEQATTMASSLPTALKVVRRARRGDHPVDAIVCTVPALPSAFVAYGIAKLTKKPLIVELRDAWPEVLHYLDQWHGARWNTACGVYKVKWFGFHILITVATRLLEHVLRSADLVITTTEALAELKHRDGCKNVEAIRNRAQPHFSACGDEHERKPGRLRVLYAGTIGRAQGLDNALKAVELVRDAGIDIELRMVGGGAHLRSLKSYTYAKRLPVTFIPRIPYRDIPSHYCWADTVLVHLQDWEPMQYTIPSKLFEVMWADQHVTACVAGEAADIVNEAQIGVVVPPMDPQALAQAWIDLANNPDRIDVSGQGALWFARHPTPDELSHRWIDAVRSVVATKTSQPQPRSRVRQLLRRLSRRAR